ncbi:uncharacterized protein NPIL_242641 [Nephila pilipes]|uniref:Uncharacterized protein n=1 Tax=Nephila pilipes TaxID=299642 RepID=A0A8X6PRL4_NEPPI|nr:uncharacterized protein NPIL_242641 [Nephila pilipes]
MMAKSKAINTEFPITYKEGITIQNIKTPQVKSYRSEAVFEKNKQYSSMLHAEGDEMHFAEMVILERRVMRNYVSSVACAIDTFCPRSFVSGIELCYTQKGKVATPRQELVIQNALNAWTKII